MGSPLSLILADIVMDDLESDCIKLLDFNISILYFTDTLMTFLLLYLVTQFKR